MIMYQLTDEGRRYMQEGLPEKNILKKLPKPVSELSNMPGAVIAVGWAKKNNWISIIDGIAQLTDAGHIALKSKTDVEIALEDVSKKGDSELARILLSRNLIEEAKSKQQEIVKSKEIRSLNRCRK